MSVVYESEVVHVVRAFRRSLREQEAAQMRLMAQAYLQVEMHLADSIAALAEQLARLRAEGEEVPFWKLARLERFQRLQEQLIAELARFNGWALSQITNEQLRLGILGMQHASQALEAMKPGISAMLDYLPHNAFSAMVGLAGDGSPLSTLLAKSGDAIRRVMLQELQRSVALGRSPRVTAAAVRKATGMGLQRALTIARTEQLRVYREATLETYRSLGVEQYMRLSAFDPNSCIACIWASGEVVSSGLSVDDHPNGMCTVVPVIPGVDVPVMESGRSWFDRQSVETQKHIMGPGRFEAYRSGAASWDEMARHVSDPVWGGAWVPAPLNQLVAGQVPVAA